MKLIYILLFLISFVSADVKTEFNRVCKEGINKIPLSSKGKEFLELIKDEKLQTDFLCSGFPVDDYSKTLSRLFQIYSSKPDHFTKPVLKKLAIACAFQLTPDANSRTTVLIDKFNFYSNSFINHKLHPSFANLPVAMMRFVVGPGNLKDLQYTQNLFNLPLSKFSHVHGYPPWSRESEFGDSIHGDFRAPYYGGGVGRAESIMTHGAVCGGKSTLAMLNAVSHGIPSVTVSATAHCAYMLYLPDQGWIRCYGGRQGGGCKDVIFNGGQTPFLFLSQRIYRNYEIHKRSMNLVWKANSSKDKTEKMKLYEEALKIQADNYSAWHTMVQFMIANKSIFELDDWDRICGQIDKQFNDLPYVTLHLTEQFLKDEIIGKGQAVPRIVKMMRNGGWTKDNFRPLVMFMRYIYKHSNRDRTAFRKLLFKEFADSPYFGPLYSHMKDKICKSAGAKEKLSQEMAKILKKGLMSSGNKRPILAGLISNARNINDKSSYHEFSDLAQDILDSTEKKLLKQVKPTSPFPGDMLSNYGILKSPFGSDKFSFLHAGTVTPKGGLFSLKASQGAYADLTLGKMGVLSGIVIQAQKYNKLNSEKYTVSISMDGKNWQDVAAINTLPLDWRIDLREKMLQARYVRLTRKAKEVRRMSVNIQRFNVYGERRE